MIFLGVVWFVFLYFVAMPLIGNFGFGGLSAISSPPYVFLVWVVTYGSFFFKVMKKESNNTGS